MSASGKAGLYEQIKDDLGYLQLNRAAECFATLADDARAHDWTHIEYLARLIAEETTSTRNRRLAARLRYARFPFHKRISDFDFEFQPSIDRKLINDLAERYDLPGTYAAIVFVILVSVAFFAAVQRIERWLRPVT